MQISIFAIKYIHKTVLAFSYGASLEQKNKGRQSRDTCVYADLEHAGPRWEGEGRDEEGDEEGVDEPVLLEKAGQPLVAAHPENVATMQVDIQSATCGILLLITGNYSGDFLFCLFFIQLIGPQKGHAAVFSGTFF